jgi:predicted phosphodiesterase
VRPIPGTRAHREWVLSSVAEAVAEHRGKRRLSRDGFLALRDMNADYYVNAHDILALGGWAQVCSLAESQELETTEGELAEKRTVSLENLYRRKLERQLGDRGSFDARLMEKIVEAIEYAPCKPRSLAPEDFSDEAIDSETVLFISDTHFGSIIDAAEVPGNRYNWRVAARRMGLLTHEAATFKCHRDGPRKLRILLGGDLIEGEIHGRGPHIDYLAEQIDGCRQLLTSMIDYLRTFYHSIEVLCVPGNHDRHAHRMGRGLEHKYDSAITPTYSALAAIFRDCADVRFTIPKTPYALWKSPGGHTCVLTHGDTVVNLGVPSKNFKIDATSALVSKLGKSRGERIDLVCVGHYHTPLVAQLEDGCAVVVNGCASGTGPYAQSLGIHGSAPAQMLWESVPGHPLGDARIVRLGAADSDAGWEDIVPVPTRVGDGNGL